MEPRRDQTSTRNKSETRKYLRGSNQTGRPVNPVEKEATLCDFCNNIVNAVWRKIAVGQTFRTPDLYRGKDFKIDKIDRDRLTILPQSVTISKSAFIAAIHYLKVKQHDMDSPCEIRSSNNQASAGPLCLAVRSQNTGVRCVNYVLPILQKKQIVGINPVRPNSTWLLQW